MTRRNNVFTKNGMLLSLLVAISVVSVGNAFTAPRPARAGSTRFFANKDADYYARLQQAAKDPAAFEQFVMSGGGDNSTETLGHSSPPANQQKKGGYQRVEDWDDQSGGHQWDQKVQFDGLRHGNGFKQNEILRHNLNTF